jgi:hypothetical protein
MGKRAIGRFDDLLSWIERANWTPWGKTLTVLILSAGLSGWAFVKALPAPIVALLFLAAVTLSAVLLVHLPLAVKDLRRFPFAIRVTETFSGNRDIQLHAVVLNRRSDRRVVLHVALRLDSAADSTGCHNRRCAKTLTYLLVQTSTQMGFWSSRLTVQANPFQTLSPLG